ncbi:MAG: hypothetical protein K2Y20_12835 [Sphingomonas sp.]|nr:hypothetical protein [Sphingomonas sp.]
MKWVVFRSFVVVSAVTIALYSLLDGVVAIDRQTRPELALGIIGYDAPAQAQLASRMQLKPDTATDGATAMSLAKMALRREPGSATAARVIGFVKLADGDVRGALQALNYAHELTRRDLAAELWLVEYAVQRGDARKALNHMDAAASTNVEIRPTLFPIMASAIADPRLAPPMTDMLARKPQWLYEFLLRAAQGNLTPEGGFERSPSSTAQAKGALLLFEMLGKRGVPLQQQLIDALNIRFADQDPDLKRRTAALAPFVAPSVES